MLGGFPAASPSARAGRTEQQQFDPTKPFPNFLNSMASNPFLQEKRKGGKNREKEQHKEDKWTNK